MRNLRGFYSDANSFTQLMITLFLAFSSLLFLFSIECVLLWAIYQPASWETFNTMMANDISLLKLSQAIQAIGFFVLPAFVAAFLLTENSVTDYLSLKNTAKIDLYLLVAMAAILLLPLVNTLAALNEAVTFPPFLHDFEVWARTLEEEAKILTERFLSVSTISGLFVNILVIAVLAAVGEELIFRGVLQHIFTRWTKNQTLGIWITAFVFSVMHFQFFGFLPRLLLGVYFGYLLVWSRTIWLPVLAHFTHNGIAVVAFYFYHNQEIAVNPDEVGVNDMLWASAVCGIPFLAILYFIRKKRIK